MLIDEAEEALEEAKAFAALCETSPDSDGCDTLDPKAITNAEKALAAAKKLHDKQVSEAKEALESTSEYTAKIKELQKQVNGATITSPVDGTVIGLSVNKGSLIAEGLIASIQESEDYKVTLHRAFL